MKVLNTRPPGSFLLAAREFFLFSVFFFDRSRGRGRGWGDDFFPKTGVGGGPELYFFQVTGAEAGARSGNEVGLLSFIKSVIVRWLTTITNLRLTPVTSHLADNYYFLRFSLTKIGHAINVYFFNVTWFIT